jgi:hypothetical protein
VARGWPKQEEWALEWINRIGELYHSNKARLAVKDEPLAWQTADQELRAQVAEMARKREEELSHENLHPARRHVLESLREHWSGLTVFVDHPHVPMDNNRAERAEYSGPHCLDKKRAILRYDRHQRSALLSSLVAAPSPAFFFTPPTLHRG